MNDEQILQDAQKTSIQAAMDLRIAAQKHRVMKRTFKGIVSYPQRKILFKVGVKPHGN